MSKKQYAQLVERAEKGTITEAEIAEVARRLRHPTNEGDIPMLLVVLGAARDLGLGYRALVELYLRDSDEVIASTALEVLCDYWNLAAEYRDYILIAMKGIPTDLIGLRQTAAIGSTGRYLQTHSDPEVLRSLLTMFESQSSDEVTRWHAYQQLAMATGGNGAALLGVSLPIEKALEKLVDPTVIRRAKERLAHEEGQDGRP